MSERLKLIAETAWHHQGDYAFMQQLVTKICAAGCADIMKMHITLDFDEYMLPSHKLYKTLKDMAFNAGQWRKIIDIARDAKKELLLLVNDTSAVDLACDVGAEMLEVHAVALNDVDLLDKIKLNITPQQTLVLGVGGSSLYEIDYALNYLQHKNIVLMFGFQSYPTNYADINFAKMRHIMAMYPDFRFGYADHTAWDHDDNALISLLGVSQGMEYLEKHVTTHYGEERIDWQAAISISQCSELYSKLSVLDACNGDGRLQLSIAEQSYGHFGPMKKAACLSRDIREGETLDRTDIVFRRCGEETDLSQMDVIGKIDSGSILMREMKSGEILRSSDLGGAVK